MTNNKLTDAELEELLTELELCGIYGRQVRALVELQEYRKAADKPIAWLNEDELPENYPYEEMFPFSKVDIVRLFPVYSPQPAQMITDKGATATLAAETISAMEEVLRISDREHQAWNLVKKAIADYRATIRLHHLS